MSIDVMKQALEALDHGVNGQTSTEMDEAITALRTAIVQAQRSENTAWVELTDEERQEIWEGCDPQHAGYVTALVEAKLREKNAAQPAPIQEPVHPDSRRIDWMTNNPLCALDIFGHVKGLDAARWIRQEIDNAIQAQEKYK